MFDLRSATTDRGYFFVSAGWSVFKQSKAMLSQTKLQSGQRGSSPPLQHVMLQKKKEQKRTKDILLNRVLTSGIGRKRLIGSRVFNLRPVNAGYFSVYINIPSFIWLF